ncbi:MAG: rod shape-determining protein MreC [Candidatus Paceibacterota bacterium]|jgi:cell shape-determining protein MreC
MIYRSKNNKGKKKIFITLVLVLVLLLGVIYTGLVSKTFYRSMLFLSFGKASTSQTASSFLGLFSSKNNLVIENQNLKSQIQAMNISVSDRDALVKENADLKASLHLRQDTQNRVGATLLSKPPFAPFDVVVINAGDKAGVKVGDRVMVGETYIGTVTSVADYSSQVQLLSSPSNKIDVFIGDKALPAVLSGKGGGNFETSIPQGVDIKEQDLVFTTLGNNNVLYVGKVSKIIQNEANTLMKVLVSFPFNLYELSYVEVISS